LGAPTEIVSLGQSELPYDIFLSYLEELSLNSFRFVSLLFLAFYASHDFICNIMLHPEKCSCYTNGLTLDLMSTRFWIYW